MTPDPRQLEVKADLPEVFRARSPQEGSEPFERESIYQSLRKYGITIPSSHLVHDFIMVARGLPVREDKEIGRDVKRVVNAERSFLDLRSWGLRKDEERERATEYNLYVADFLRRVTRNSIPGRTDADKAMSLAMIAGELKNAFESGMSSEEFGDRVNEMFDRASELTPEELATLAGLPHPTGSLIMHDGPDPEDPELTEVVKEKEFHPADPLERDPARDDFSQLRHTMQVADIASRMITDIKLRRVLEVARILKGKVGLGTTKSSRLVEDQSGSERVVRTIRDVSEIPNLLPSEMIYQGLSPAILLQRIIDGEALVQRKVSRVRKRQLLYVLIDGSGSMRCGQSIQIAGGVMMNRLSAVAKGDGALFYRFFDEVLREENQATDPEDVSRHLRDVLSFPYDVEETCLQEAVEGALERINEIGEEGQYDRPHLLIISDGDAKFKVPKDLIQGTVVHAVLIDSKNESLKELVQRTRGVLIEFGSKA